MTVQDGTLYYYTIAHVVTCALLAVLTSWRGAIAPRHGLSLLVAGLGIVLSVGLLHSAIVRLTPGSHCGNSGTALAALDAGAVGALLAALAAFLAGLCTHDRRGGAGSGHRGRGYSKAGVVGAVDVDDMNAAQVPLLDSSSVNADSSAATTTTGDSSGAAASAAGSGSDSTHDVVGWIGRILFSFLDALFLTGMSRQLQLADVDAMPAADETQLWSDRFAAQLQQWREAQAAADGGAPQSKRPLLSVILRVFGFQWSLLGFLQAGCVGMALVSPLVMQRVLAYLQADSGSTDSSPWFGLLWAALMALTQGGAALFTTGFCYWFTRVQLRLRASLVTAVFQGMLRSPLHVRAGLSYGRLNNFVSVDIQKLMDVVPSFHQFWSLPIQVGITLYMLYVQVQWAFSAGLVIVVAFVPLNYVVSKRIGALTSVMLTHRDERVRMTGEVLSGMRVIKLQAWEVPLMDRIRAARALELRALASRKYLDAVCVLLWAATPVLIALATFTTVVVFLPDGATFSASIVFTTVSLLNLLIFPLNALPWVLSGMMEAWVSLHRLQQFICYAAAGQQRSSVQAAQGAWEQGLLLSAVGQYKFPVSSDKAAKDDDKDKDEEEVDEAAVSGSNAFTLDITPSAGVPLQVRAGELVLVCGAVGSGKSALLSALLGDMVPLTTATHEAGTAVAAIQLGPGCTVSYSPQVAWIRGATVKQNIVSSCKWDAARYAAVVRACCLGDDIATLSAGDDTPVTDSTLSGGQQARISLARALYDRSSLVLADDVLAALDARVGLAIWDNVFGRRSSSSSSSGGLLAAEGRACLLVTHDTRFLSQADVVVVLAGGRVAHVGPPASLTAELRQLAGFKAAAADSDREVSVGSDGALLPTSPVSSAAASDAAASSAAATTSASATTAGADAAADDEDEEVEREEIRQAGVVKQRVIMTYVSAVGKALAVIVLVSLTVMQLSRNAADWWLSIWSAAATDPSQASGGNAALVRLLADWDNKQFLLVYGLIALVNLLATIVRSWSFAASGIRAAITVHDKLLRSVLFAPMAFHDRTPAGRLLNRFSADQYAIDETLPFQLNILLAQLFGMAGTLIVLAYSTSGVFLFALPILAWLYFRLQRVYRATSRELKRLDSVTRSPLYSHLGDCLEGTAVVRAASLNRPDTTDAVATEFNTCTQLLDTNQRTSFASGMAAQWLALRLQAIGMGVLAVVAFFAAGTRILTDAAAAATTDDACVAIATNTQYVYNSTAGASGSGSSGGDHSAAGIAGLALSYALPIVGTLQGLIGAFAETEKELVSVERAREYMDVPPEEDAALEGQNTAARSGNDANEEGEAGEEAEAAALLPAAAAPVPRGITVAADDSNWQPSRGEITFDTVSVRYPDTLRAALGGISFTVAAGTSLGIAGRTGSGKSTCIAALFRLVPLNTGRILIDGVDTRLLPLRTLRRAMAIIPQEPLLWKGCVRDNLDVRGIHSDSELLAALKQCHLRGGEGRQWQLDDEIEEGGRNVAVGERQLLCLARALLLRTRILVIDEASANVDSMTQERVQSALAGAFAGATVLSVAHRLETLRACTRVLVLADGCVGELGPPQDLLRRPGSHFARLVAASETMR